jgi:hypothetical protein
MRMLTNLILLLLLLLCVCVYKTLEYLIKKLNLLKTFNRFLYNFLTFIDFFLFYHI